MYDLSIIGAGWAGFNAAVRARSLGLKVALIEESFIGGTCLNTGCIPTKSLVQSAKMIAEARKAKDFGIDLPGEPQVNFSAIQARKDKIVGQLRKGMESGLSGIDYFTGHAQLTDNRTVKLTDRSLEANYILLACGSRPFELPDFPFDGKKILSSDQILSLDRVPGSLLVIGGGVIGCEFAGIFAALGSKVTIVELTPQLLPGVDQEIAKKLENSFKKKRVGVLTSTDARSLDRNNFELILVCVGRKPRIEGLGNAGIKTARPGVVVDEYLRTSAANVYAAGDCTGKLMLAHFASYQGVSAVEDIKAGGGVHKADNKVVPSCIFTSPEIASVGLNEDQARQNGGRVKVNKFDFLGSGMARIIDETEGFLKIVSDESSGKLLGAQLIGPKATELIAFFSLAITSGLGLNELKRTIIAHPTLSEAIVEALE